MGKYFNVEELSRSSRASKAGIDNTPSKEIEKHLEELIEVLDQIREEWGSAIIVTSGYRCDELNKLVKGSSTSAHTVGYAVDMHPKKGTIEKLYKFIAEFLKSNRIAFDQLIIETSRTGSWVHFGLKNRQGKQRRQIFRLDV